MGFESEAVALELEVSGHGSQLRQHYYNDIWENHAIL